ncbi:hypothetical protein SAMN02745866_01070 [Alteromonadaceae bacterium Bs31]|nr:hypothetical protein SAMN02745866_01070 [Alteromonadaceae bacterium Bs31]
MKPYTLFIACALFAFFAPKFGKIEPLEFNKPSWPEFYNNQALVALPLSEREMRFAEGFPGAIGRFQAGKNEIIIRRVEEPTRKLHPARDCFKGIGYKIIDKPLSLNHEGIAMACFHAQKGEAKFKVCEYVQGDQGESWSDISSWYWAALFSRNSRWWSYVIAQPIQ